MIALALNEGSLPRLLWYVLTRRKVYLIDINPVFPPFTKLFVRVSNILLARHRLNSIFDIVPLEPRFRVSATTHERAHYFVNYEPWANSYFQFDDAIQTFGAYEMVFKGVSCNYLQSRHIPVWILSRLADRDDVAITAIYGLDSEIIPMLMAATGKKISIPCYNRLEIRPVVNFLMGLMYAGFIVAAILKRIRFRVPTEEFDLGVDYVRAEHHFNLIREITAGGRDPLVVFRSKKEMESEADIFPDFQRTHQDHGTFTPISAVRTAWLALTTLAKFNAPVSNLPPPLTFSFLKTVWRRTAYSALMDRYQFKYFLCRDDYNPEHIVRTHELRRHGATSIGITHGLPHDTVIEAAWRYLDFDVYYIHGIALYESYYRETWSPKMKVVPVGTILATRDQLERRYDSKPRKNGVVYFASPADEKDILMMEEMCHLADVMPEKEVLVKIKRAKKKQGYGDTLVNMIEQGPANIRETTEDSYELMLDYAYAITGATTVAAEAINFGMKTFVLDHLPTDQPYYYRDFSGWCFPDIDTIIEKIRAVESGREIYDFSHFEGLIHQGRLNVFDVIRLELGMPIQDSVGEAAVSKMESLAHHRGQIENLRDN
jgi:hypothetical protein